MVSYTVKCENLFTEEEEEVTLYFHLTEAELTMLDLANNAAYTNFKDEKETAAQKIFLFEQIIKKAYGQKTPDGMFVKTDQARDAFLCSPAYSALLGKITSGEIKIQDFILGCMPKKISKKLNVGEDGSINIKES